MAKHTSFLVIFFVLALIRPAFAYQGGDVSIAPEASAGAFFQLDQGAVSQPASTSFVPSLRIPVPTNGPIDFISMLFVFILATFIGLMVISRVSRLLHTPLMSLTNAISAIAVVGSILLAGSEHSTGINILGAVALFASMTNIVSGFLVTNRMLKMFKTKGKST